MVQERNPVPLTDTPHDHVVSTLQHHEEERFRAIFDYAGIGVALGDLTGRLCETNPALRHMLGYQEAEINGHHVDEFTYPDDRHIGRRELGEMLRGRRERYQVEKRFRHKDGRLIWMRLTVSLVRDDAHEPRFVVGLAEDVTERKQAEEELHQLIRTDELTGLYNRRGFFLLAEQQLKLARRHRQAVLLLFADLDNMKQLNDTLGHAGGDRALLAVAAVLRQAFRESDIVARVGGDEFAMLAIDAARENVPLVLGRIEEGLRAHATPLMPLSLSCGAAHFDPERPLAIQELLRQADAAMYAVKHRKTRPGRARR